MSQSSKSAYYRALKGQGVKLEKHYRDYSTDELRIAWEALAEKAGLPPLELEPPKDAPPPPSNEIAEIREQIAGLGEMMGKLANIVSIQARQPQPSPPQPPAPQPKQTAQPPQKAPKLDPREHAGVTLNTQAEGEVIRVDEYGNQWYQNEVNKPGFPKPRGRRILRAMDSGTVEQTITVNGYTETFEIPGDPQHAKPIEIKVTLPSYQTGIYKAPGMPFKIHVYQGNRGFDWDDVNKYYGGVDLVPDTIKRTYVSSDLCYDMTTTIRAIQDEYRERVLKKEALR